MDETNSLEKMGKPPKKDTCICSHHAVNHRSQLIEGRWGRFECIVKECNCPMYERQMIELEVDDEVTIKWHAVSRFAGSRGTIISKGKFKPYDYVVEFPPVREGFAKISRTFTEEDFIGYGDYI